jgi:hypothetical protein
VLLRAELAAGLDALEVVVVSVFWVDSVAMWASSLAL